MTESPEATVEDTQQASPKKKTAKKAQPKDDRIAEIQQEIVKIRLAIDVIADQTGLTGGRLEKMVVEKMAKGDK